MVGGSRKESGDASDFGAIAKKPPRAHHSHKQSQDAVIEGTNAGSKQRASPSNLANSTKNKSMAITVAIEELGEENIIKRTKSYMTEKKLQYVSPEKPTPNKSTTQNIKEENMNLLEVKNFKSPRSKSSSTSLALELPKDAIEI